MLVRATRLLLKNGFLFSPLMQNWREVLVPRPVRLIVLGLLVLKFTTF